MRNFVEMLQGSCAHAVPIALGADGASHARHACNHDHMLHNAHDLFFCLQGDCRHALSVSVGTDGASHAYHVRHHGASGGGGFCGQHMDGNCGQLLLRAKLLVSQ